MSWSRRFLKLAEHIAQWSKDPSSRVGCVLADEMRRVIGLGYNGFPRGVSDSRDRYDNRAVKYAMVQHAEANAILNAVSRTEGATAYVTHHPCSNCAGLLIQAGVQRVVIYPPGREFLSRNPDNYRLALVMLREAGVELVEFPRDV